MSPVGLLADVVLVVHAAFIVFVVVGGFLALRWTWIAWIHVPCAIWGAWVELAGRVCPLTPLEASLREAAGGTGYSGSFIERYLLPVIYPGSLTREIQIVLGVFVILVNLVAYALLLRRSRRPEEEVREGEG